MTTDFECPYPKLPEVSLDENNKLLRQTTKEERGNWSSVKCKKW